MINELKDEFWKEIEHRFILQINEFKDYPVKYECVCGQNRNESRNTYAERVHNRNNTNPLKMREGHNTVLHTCSSLYAWNAVAFVTKFHNSSKNYISDLLFCSNGN